MTKEQWQAVDEVICAGARLEAIKQIQQNTGLDLKDALRLLYDRYEQLRAEAPDKFGCSHDEYWQGWHN